MKKLTAASIMISALVLVSAIGWRSQAQPLKARDFSLSGVEVPTGARGALGLVGRAGGPLPGSFELSIRYNPVTGEVGGGTWKFMLEGRDKGGRPHAEGTIYGTVDGGTVELNRHGKVESLKGVRMSLRRGAGRYSGVSGAVGEVEGTIAARRRHPFVGRLRFPL